MKLMRTLLMVGLALLLSAAIFAQGEQDQGENQNPAATYPSKAIQVIVPAGAGGDTDMNARLFSKYLEQELGKPVVVSNVSGGSGTIAMQQVMSAAPDGQTVIFFHVEAMIPKIAGMVDYDINDFAMCGIGVVDNTTVLATHNDAPYKNMKELVSYAKANPGDVEFGMAIGGYPHLIGIALEKIADIDLNLVDIGGNAAKTVALKGKKTDVINTQYGLTKDYFTSGDFVCLGSTSLERNPLMPADIMTTAEQGYPMEFNKFFWYGMPKDTPQPIVDKFSAAMKRVVDTPEYQAEAKKIYVTPTYMGPAEALAYAAKTRDFLMQFQDLFRASAKK